MSILAASLIVQLLLGFPFVVVILSSLLLYIFLYMPTFDCNVIVQQVIAGMLPRTLVAIPMFILAASILTAGRSTKGIVRLVRAFIGHLPGGLAITTVVACTLFGSVSGSTQATVAAIGGPTRRLMLEAGYPSSFTLGLIINSSDISYMIPPSIGFIIYGVVTGTSIGSLFLAGIGPGVLITVLFSLYCFWYAKRKKIPVDSKSSWNVRLAILKENIPIILVPVIVIGGIYAGIFSPTEAAAVAVLYALVLEGLVYKSLNWESLIDCFLTTGIVTAVSMLLVGAGQALSWLISYLRIPQQILPQLFGSNPSELHVYLVIITAYFIGCMFVDPVVLMYIFTPIFAPYVIATGINPVLLGVVVVLQCAIGSATPPFGVDIFTAQLIFRRPYLEVIAHTYPFVAILILSTALLLVFPQISLFLPGLAG